MKKEYCSHWRMISLLGMIAKELDAEVIDRRYLRRIIWEACERLAVERELLAEEARGEKHASGYFPCGRR